MNVQDCYRILGVAPGSGMESVKTAFRRQAFKLHPDLNPSKDAQAQFQRINEAYVLLKDALQEEPPPQKETPPKASAKEGAKAYQHQQSNPESAQASSTSTPPHAGKKSRTHSRKNFFYRKEEVLGDILNDPFARQVYEDIYKHVRKGNGAAGSRSMERSLEVNLGKRGMTFDLSRGPITRLKDWCKGQLDDKQTVTFPAHALIPGRTIRLEISSRFGKPRTIEVRIPADFRIGKPIRLRGLGRSLGPFKGDMFLNILGK